MTATIHTPTDLRPSGNIRRQRRIEKGVIAFLLLIASTGVIVTTGLVLSLVQPTISFFSDRAISGYGADEFVGIEESADTGLRDSSELDFADESGIISPNR